MANQNLDTGSGSSSSEDKRSNALINKYKDMADMRRDYDDIDIRDCIPTLDEMVKDELMYELLEDIANGKTEDDVKKAAFYAEEPPTKQLGYNNNKNAFVCKVSSVNLSNSDIKLNKIDGDILRIPMDSLQTSELGQDESFTLGGVKYDGFKDYCKKKGLDSSMLQLKLYNVECPEIPHFEVQAMKPEDIVSMTVKQAKSKAAVMLKYDYTGTAALERDDSKTIKLYKIKSGSGYKYHEIIGDGASYAGVKNTSSLVYNIIVSTDNSKKDSLVGGYKAQKVLIDLINNKEVYIAIDLNGVKSIKKSNAYKLYYNHWWNAVDTVKDMIDQWCNYTGQTNAGKLVYSPYGTDEAGRFTAEMYVKNNGEYVNVGKYILADDEVKASISKDSSVEMDNLGGTTSNFFEAYSYDKNNRVYLDAFNSATYESYNKRIKFHQEVSGLDFTKLRNCTMLIGDTLMLIPPQNIRSISSIDYERVGIMRGKGSMVKNQTNREMFLEVDLFFYNEDGINGIDTLVTLPNGEEMTYYMNGLRSLIAQFKVAPYLPIENQFVNDVLGIEAVSLVNLSVNTVEGIPRLLQATLTLRDFNYRIYMPDIPIDYGYNQVSEIAVMDPIFAKCFNWEVFRYYYQRSISFGSKIKEEQTYNTYEYNKEIYYYKEALQPVRFCEYGSHISFYVPDENWLKTALQIKKDKEKYGNPVPNEEDDAVDNTDINKNSVIKVDGGDMSGSRQANVRVNVGYGNREYWAYTNKFSQLVKVTAKKIILQDDSKEPVNDDGRYYPDEANVPGTKDKGMAAGHVIADSLGGVANAYNITPQNSTLNKNGKIAELEKRIRQAGGCTNFTATMTYPNSKTQIPSSYNYTYTINGKTYNEVFYNTVTGIEEVSQEDLNTAYNYLDPAAMKFVPYLETVELQSIGFSMSNNFTDITLKVMDGFAPQYMGASDITIEATLITDDQSVISRLNVLPAHASNIGKLYRRILSCWPIKVRNQYLQMAGINEVLIDLIEIQTVQGWPGLYEVKIRMTSVDRTIRMRETMKQLESDQVTTNKATASMHTYWDLNNVLATAELYPDLDLPSIKELEQRGFYFLRYKNTKQAYPDPDFYITYGYPYTAYIIKKNLKEVFYNKIFHDEGKEKSEILDDANYEFFDQMGMTLYKKLDPKNGMTEGVGKGGKSQNELADLFDQEIEVIDSAANEAIVKKTAREEAEELAEQDCADLSDLLIYLTACDIQDGWTLKPGYTAPIVASETNLSIEKLECSGIKHDKVTDGEKNNQAAKDIFELRKQAINAIDAYLSEPINYSKYRRGNTADFSATSKTTSVYLDIKKTVDQFCSEAKAKEILKLLNPFETKFKATTQSSAGTTNEILKTDYTEPNLANYLIGYLHAAARCITAKNVYAESGGSSEWEGQQFLVDSSGKVVKDSKGNKIPNCKVDIEGKPISQAESLEEALNCGIQWGLFQIKKYRGSELQRIMKPKSRVQYVDAKTLPMYKDPKTGKERWHPGFIDPYYNIAGYKSAIGKEYIKEIATDAGCNTIAFIRVMLMHLRRMIIDGQIFSEIDVVARDYDDIAATVLDKHIDTADNWKATLEKLGEVAMDVITLPLNLVENVLSLDFSGLGEQGYDLFIDNTVEYFDDTMDIARMNSLTDALGNENDAGTIKELIEGLPDTYARSFCARLVYPFVFAVSEHNSKLDIMITGCQVNELNSLTNGAFITSADKTVDSVVRYCSAMNSVGMMDYSRTKTDPETTSDSQKLWNYIMKEAYTKLADDPQAYVLHSYYDMLINDKRGRLLRAFPTYYMVFMDEGRKIGSWKLFDNFYNMSAISEITVSKSRKIPADTCTFVMSNMYSSYAAEYDNTTKQQYIDVYGLRDVFNSIFCPKEYVKKEDALKRREQNLETVVLQPGVRIHVRMGYGSDASRLPIAFNGKIAEIDVGDVVQVVAQGDGHELYNPLNALGEIDAVTLSEAESWFPYFKDLRGSMRRAGESPRNLLAKLLTAQYGGAFKTVVREWSDERWYGDNPFGIYHFGDKRFNSIFEEGEAVQNLYEICDANLLKGVNELYASEENCMATPTINTSIQDKTFWDILHLCANSGVNYIGAVRDFDMRSTVCLCKPNHYYAYSYKKIDDENGGTSGKIVECRKPFQQYHYYDSYTDIVYNSIKASEKNMKTNATGIWESTDMIWGRSQSTVGPIYLDMNIYPENQKSMTVDTTLVSDGSAGLELNLFTHFAEKWASDEKDTKVNQALARRVTTNVLRESVSNMYCGELCVLGDTSIKPHDRFFINDCYEDMQGHMEVEGVVYSMNSSTGFTTTIYPDLIVRSDDPHEPAKRMVDGTFLGSCTLAVGARLGAISTFARLDSALVRGLAQAAKVAASSPVDDILTAAGSFLHINKASTLGGAAANAMTATATCASFITTAVIAAGIYICANNVKTWATNFLQDIQALTVYPITRYGRPLIAGMAGHKGSVFGYPYTEADGKDSIQGVIVNSVEWLNNAFPFDMGDTLMDMFVANTTDSNGNKISEYQRLKEKWSQTLPLAGKEPELYDVATDNAAISEGEKKENLLRELYSSVNNEYRSRFAMIQALRTKYRIDHLTVSKDDKVADEVYQRYNITNVNSIDALATNEKVLSLYPIEDDIDIKQATVEKSHPVVKQLTIAHSQGNVKAHMPFESGNRIIKLFSEGKTVSSNGKSGNVNVFDLPMLQEDALIILKLILNDQALKKAKVSFLSGARINDVGTWSSTGFAFILSANDKSALEDAVKNVQEATTWLQGDKKQIIFEYKAVSEGIKIIVYAPKNSYNE